MSEKIDTQIKDIKKGAEEYSLKTPKEIEQFRIEYLGNKGKLKTLFIYLKDIPNEEKKQVGEKLNNLKSFLENLWKEAKQTHTISQHSTSSKDETIDISLPGEKLETGTQHPISIIKNEICYIFQTVGFSIAEGPEIEDDWHNFEALNIPTFHPARDMQDTFYIRQNPDYVLRTHTSNIQIREMKKGLLPIQIICPGKVFRNETVSARSHYFFHQIEGLVIHEKVSFADLKTILYYFTKQLFGENTKVRFRPSYFPFTEPSAEMDVSCLICQGKKCNVCKYTGWLEILGCGMVHPNVLKNCSIDPEKYTGYAFGMGIERITMLKYQINDLRVFTENHIDFLKQFS